MKATPRLHFICLSIFLLVSGCRQPECEEVLWSAQDRNYEYKLVARGYCMGESWDMLLVKFNRFNNRRIGEFPVTVGGDTRTPDGFKNARLENGTVYVRFTVRGGLWEMPISVVKPEAYFENYVSSGRARSVEDRKTD